MCSTAENRTVPSIEIQRIFLPIYRFERVALCLFGHDQRWCIALSRLVLFSSSAEHRVALWKQTKSFSVHRATNNSAFFFAFSIWKFVRNSLGFSMRTILGWKLFLSKFKQFDRAVSNFWKLLKTNDVFLLRDKIKNEQDRKHDPAFF